MQEGLFTQSVLYRFTSQWNANHNHYLMLLSYREESKLSRVVTGLNYKINSCIQILWCLMPSLKWLKTHSSEISWVSKATIVQKIPQVKMMGSTLDRKCNKCWGNIVKNLKRTENNHLHVSRQVHDIKTCLVLQIFSK